MVSFLFCIYNVQVNKNIQPILSIHFHFSIDTGVTLLFNFLERFLNNSYLLGVKLVGISLIGVTFEYVR